MDISKTNNFTLLCIINFFQGMVFYAPIAALFRISRGLSFQQIFLMESILLITTFCLEIPFGYFTNKYGYKGTINLSLFLLLISKIILFFSYNIISFMFHSVIFGASIASMSGCEEAFLYDSIKKDNSEKAFGIFNSMNRLGFALACLLSIPMIKISYDLPVLITILPTLLAFVISFKLENLEMVNDVLKLKDVISIIKGMKSIVILILATTIIAEVSHSIEAYLNQPLLLKYGFNADYFGLFSIIVQIASMFSLFTHKITKKFANHTLLILSSLIFIGIISLNFQSNLVFIILTLFLIQGFTSMMMPAYITAQNLVIINNRALFLSVFSMISTIIASILNIYIGKFADLGISKALSMGSVFIGISVVFLSIYIKIIRE